MIEADPYTVHQDDCRKLLTCRKLGFGRREVEIECQWNCILSPRCNASYSNVSCQMVRNPCAIEARSRQHIHFVFRDVVIVKESKFLAPKIWIDGDKSWSYPSFRRFLIYALMSPPSLLSPRSPRSLALAMRCLERTGNTRK